MARTVIVLVAALAWSACVRWSPVELAPASSGACREETLQWSSPKDTDQRARLDAWCAGVGVPIFQTSGGAGSPAVAAISDVAFVSWNVHVGSGRIRSFVDDLRKGLHTNGRRFPHYILLLQEAARTDGVPVFAPGAKGAKRIAPHDAEAPIDIVRVSRDLGMSLVYVPSMRNGDEDDPAEDRGSAIVSTLPLSNAAAIELPGERQRRVVITAQAGLFSVAVVHLDALGAARRLRVFWTPWMRDVQVRSMIAALPSGPLVIGADLNTWHGRDELAARTLRDVFRDTPLTIDRHGLGLRVLDYLFFRAEPGRRARYRQIPDRYGSDHHPLVGWVE